MRACTTKVVPAVLLAALALAGCSAADTDPGASGTPGTESQLSGELTIYAAASLGTAFDEIATAFETANPGVEVQPIVYDGSSTLATQIIEGASIDVFASADEKNLQKVVDAGLATGETPLFATNTLVIAVPSGNPAGIETLADLANSGVTTVLCAADVPCGTASHQLLDLAGVSVTPASEEQNVTAVLTKVAAGEADAGLVYATDAAASADVEAIVPEHADEVVNRYPLTVLDGAPNAEVAAAFVAFVTGPEGRAILERLGFGAPTT